MGNLLEKRPSSQIGQAALDTLKQRLTSFDDLTPGVVSNMYDRLEECHLPGPMKEDVLMVLDNLNVQSVSNVKLETKASSLSNVGAYLTAKELEELRTCHLLDAMRVVAERLKKLGIKSMKEDTKRGAIAVVLHFHVNVKGNPLPCPWSIYGLVADFYNVFQSAMVDKPIAGLAMYPVSPTSLPKQWLQQAYGDEWPSMASLQVASFYSKIVLRSSSNLLHGEPPKHLAYLKEGCAKKPSEEEPLVEKLGQFMDKFLSQAPDRDASRLSAHKQVQQQARPSLSPEPLPLPAPEPLPLPAAKQSETALPVVVPRCMGGLPWKALKTKPSRLCRRRRVQKPTAGTPVQSPKMCAK